MKSKSPSRSGFWKSLGISLVSLFQFNSLQRSIIIRKSIQDSQAPEDWLHTFRRLGRFDKANDRIRNAIYRSVQWLFWLPILLTGLAYAAGDIISDFIPSFKFWWYYPLLISSVLSLVLYLMYRFLKSLDIQNYFRDFVVPLMAILKEEVYPNSEITLALALGKKTRKKYLSQVEQNYRFSGLSKFFNRLGFIIMAGLGVFTGLLFKEIIHFKDDSIFVMVLIGSFFSIVLSFVLASALSPAMPWLKTWHYEIPWLRFEVRLADKSLLRVQILEKLQKTKLTRQKRGSSGKIKVKSKIKYKSRQEYRIQVAFPKHKYALSSKSSGGEHLRVKSKEGEKRSIIQLKAKSKSKNLNTVPNLKYFLDIVGKAYRQVQQKSSEA